MRKVLRTVDAATYIGLAVATLEKMRLRGDGPPFVRLGCRAVGYDLADLDEWIEERKAASTSDRAS
jgi:predicted DNA-binding transcriptional regulator AlpA